MAESSMNERGALEQSDTRRRIWAIVGASSGIWLNGLILCLFILLSILPISFSFRKHHHSAITNRRCVCRGFLMRPIGGWLFGRIADRRGRKASMLISVCMMCMGSLVIACLPGYATIGTWAPALLLLARLFQGYPSGRVRYQCNLHE